MHRREVVHESPWVVFPGNIQGRHIRETGPRGCVVVSVEGGRVSDVEFRDIDVLRFAVRRVDLTACERFEGVPDQVRGALVVVANLLALLVLWALGVHVSYNFV